MDVAPLSKCGGDERRCRGGSPASEHGHKAVQYQRSDCAAARPTPNTQDISRSVSHLLHSCASPVLYDDRIAEVEAKQRQLDGLVQSMCTLGQNITSRLAQFDHTKATITNLNNEIRAIGVSAVQAKIMDTIDDQMDGSVVKRLEATCIPRVSPAKVLPVPALAAAASANGNAAKRRRVEGPAGGKVEQRCDDDDDASIITVSSEEGDSAAACAPAGDTAPARTGAAHSDAVAQQRQRTNAWVVGGSGGERAASTASSSAAQMRARAHAQSAMHAASASTASASRGHAATPTASGSNARMSTSDVVELTQAPRASPHAAARLRPQLHVQHRPDRLVLTMCWPHGDTASLLKQYQVVYAMAGNGSTVATENTHWAVVRILPIRNGAAPKTAHVTKNESGSYFLGARAVLHNGMCTMVAYERVDC